MKPKKESDREMTNEVATSAFGTDVSMPNAAALSSALKQSSTQGARGGAPGGSSFLNFSGKKGTYQVGISKRLVGPDEMWLVNIASFEDGWVCWKGGAPKAKRFAGIMDTPVPVPDTEEFGPFDSSGGEGWYQAKAMILKSVDEDEQGYFSINSLSGVSAFSELQGDVATQMEAGQPAWPLVTLGSEEFKAQGHKNSKPVFTITGWLDDARMQQLFSDPDVSIDDLIEASGVSEKVTAKVDSVEEAETVDDKPRRRRRAAS